MSADFEEFVHTTLTSEPLHIGDAIEAIIARHRVYTAPALRYPDNVTSRDLIASALAVADTLAEDLDRRKQLPSLPETWLLRAAEKWKRAYRK